MSFLKSEVKSSVLSGESREDAIKNIRLSAFSEDRLYDFWHSKNVASVYNEFMNKKEAKITSISKNEIKKRVEVKKEPVQAKSKKSVNKKIYNINYISFNTAMKRAKFKNKIVFLNLGCKYCDELDAVIASNDKVKNILNKYFEVVNLNSDYDTIPYNIRIEHTPTLIFLKPNSKRPLMNLTGINALGELL